MAAAWNGGNETMRGSHHIGRTNAKGQAYNVNHNDRTFKQEKSLDYDKHIDASKSQNNIYCVFGTKNPTKPYKLKDVSLRDYELKFYTRYFGAHLEQTNAKYIKNRHKERVRTIEDVYTNPRTCPQETILQVGKDGEYKDLETFHKMVRRYCAGYNKAFSSNSLILDYSIHADETSMHAHVRRIFFVEDKDGNLELAQNKALEQLGYPLPNPDQKRSKYNNRLQPFTDDLREFWYQVVEKCDQDIKIEREPKYASMRRLEKLDFQNLIAEERLEQLQAEQEQTQKETKADIERYKIAQEKLRELKKEYKTLEQSTELHRQKQEEILQASMSYMRKRHNNKMEYLRKHVKIPGVDTREWDNSDWESWWLKQQYGSIENAIKAMDEEIEQDHAEMLEEVADIEYVSQFAKTVLEDAERELSHPIKKSMFKKNETIIQATPEQVREVFEMSANLSVYLQQQKELQEQMMDEIKFREEELAKWEKRLAEENKQNTMDRKMEIAKAVSDATNQVKKEKNFEIKNLKSELSEYKNLEQKYPDVKDALAKARGAELKRKAMEQLKEVAGTSYKRKQKEHDEWERE